MADILNDKGIDVIQVADIYSKYTPCVVGLPNCSAFLDKEFPKAINNLHIVLSGRQMWFSRIRQ